jgi:hypothetical protein
MDIIIKFVDHLAALAKLKNDRCKCRAGSLAIPSSRPHIQRR